jgi:hypothetical protein
LGSQLWTEGASAWPHEREALAFVRARFPSYEPYRAWTNVEFIAEDGSVNEVDLLAVTPRGLFLVEIKSWPGVLSGDGQRWRLKRPTAPGRCSTTPCSSPTRRRSGSGRSSPASQHSRVSGHHG